MPDQLEYVITGALLQCSEGTVPGLFQTTPRTTKIGGLLAGNELDKAPIANIPSFIICNKLTQQAGGTPVPCVPVTTQWQDTYSAKVGGGKALLFKSCIQCSAGQGKIEFITSGQTPVPPEISQQLAEMKKESEDALAEAEKEKNAVGEAGLLEGMIPIWGSGRDLIHAVQTGDGWGMALNAGFLVWDVVSVVAGALSFGTATVAMMGAKTGVRAALKAAAKVTAQAAAKKAAQVAAKSAALKQALKKGSIKALASKIPKVCVMACFPAGTPIAVQGGYKNIETIAEGDLVWAWNEQTGDLALKPVLHTMRRESDALIEIGVADEKIRATPEHPFWVNGAWKEAGELEPGDALLRSDGFQTPILNIKHQTESSTKVYNFEVADWHTYLVGYWMWIVHNTSGRKTVCLKGAAKQVAQKWDDLGKLMHCFVAGTLVDTPRGKVAIELIESGDEVYAFDTRSRQRVIGRVGERYRHWTEQLVSVHTEEGIVRSTRKHRFWVECSGAWIAAAELQPGMTLRNGQGEEIILLQVRPEEERADTFNFEVIGEHNYFVGPAALLVHNQNPPGPPSFPEKIPAYIKDSDYYKSRDVTKKYTFYKILDKDGKPVYVGQTTEPGKRATTHLREKLKNQGFDPDDFKIERINKKPIKMNSFQAHAREHYYIKKLKTMKIALENLAGDIIVIGNKEGGIKKAKFNWLSKYIGCP